MEIDHHLKILQKQKSNLLNQKISIYHLHFISFSVNGTPKSRFNEVIISIVGNKLYRADELNLCT
jgi:hypothetical protein